MASIPDRIGPYDIVKVIGRGGMGLTLEAMRADLEKPCVIKLMLPELSSIPMYREMFANEGRIGAQLRHNRIVGVFDRGELPDGRMYLVMDRVDGVNLERFLKAFASQEAGLLDVGLVVYIIGELLEALAYAHGRLLARIHDISVIHRDITPGNVLISSQGEVLLTDFGIARWVDESGRVSKPVGTVLYMAPEVLLNRVSRQSDLYSVGTIFHELLTGSPPLDKVPEDARTEALLTAPVPPTGRDDVARELEALRMALLQRHPEKRLRTADEGLRMLTRYVRGGGYRATSVELRDQYLRLIGPPSSGWTGFLQSAEKRGTEPAIQSAWVERWRSENAKLVALRAVEPAPSAPSDRLWWANDPEPQAEANFESREADAPSPEGAPQPSDDETHTQPWEASPPPAADARAVEPSAPAVELPRMASSAPDDASADSRTRLFRRVVKRRASGAVVDPDGRVEAPLRHRKAVLQRAAAASPPSAAQAEAGELEAPRVPTDKLVPATQGPPTPTDPGSSRKLAGMVLAFFTATAAALGHGPTERADIVHESEVLP